MDREPPLGNSSLSVGSKVRVTNTPTSCCGVLQQNWTGVVEKIIPNENVVILTDGTLCWEDNLEVIK